MRRQGGYIGFTRVPTIDEASGVWSLADVDVSRRANIWPILGDSYFSNVAVLLRMEGDGQTFTDVSGTPKSVTAAGTATQSTAQRKFGAKSCFCDGQGWLRIASIGTIGSGDFAIEGWFYFLSLPSSGNYRTLWAHRSGPGQTGGALLVINGSAIEYFIAGSSGWQVAGGSTGLNCSTGQWHHIALTRSGSTCRAYLNGTGGTACSVSGTVGTSGDFSLMAGSQEGSQEVHGFADEFRVTFSTNRGYGVGATINVPSNLFPSKGIQP